MQPAVSGGEHAGHLCLNFEYETSAGRLHISCGGQVKAWIMNAQNFCRHCTHGNCELLGHAVFCRSTSSVLAEIMQHASGFIVVVKLIVTIEVCLLVEWLA